MHPLGMAYNSCQAHERLRTLSPQGPWQERAPAMATGPTGQSWTLR